MKQVFSGIVIVVVCWGSIQAALIELDNMAIKALEERPGGESVYTQNYR